MSPVLALLYHLAAYLSLYISTKKDMVFKQNY